MLISPFFLFSKRNKRDLFKLPTKTILLMIIIGIILAAHFAFWISSLRFTSVASSVLLVTAHPIFVTPFAHYYFKEKIKIKTIIGIFLSLTGVVVLVLGNYGLGSLSIDSFEGNILALLGGITAGLYIIGGRKIRKNVSLTNYAFIVYLTGAGVLFFLCLFTQSNLLNINLKDYQILILLALISGIFGHTFYNWTLKHLRTSIASVALLGEPLGSMILAYLIPWIQQTPSKYTIIGGIIILTGIYITAKE
jgi:drug/metabolite transporter (DMT)-like permease